MGSIFGEFSANMIVTKFERKIVISDLPKSVVFKILTPMWQLNSPSCKTNGYSVCFEQL